MGGYVAQLKLLGASVHRFLLTHNSHPKDFWSPYPITLERIERIFVRIKFGNSRTTVLNINGCKKLILQPLLEELNPDFGKTFPK